MAKDVIHDAVKNALIKDGWTITADPYNRKIIVEIKSFSGRSFIKDFQQALGQYKMYLDVIELTQLDYELYLALSALIYDEFFTQQEVETLVQRNQLKLLVVHIDQEEVFKWIN